MKLEYMCKHCDTPQYFEDHALFTPIGTGVICKNCGDHAILELISEKDKESFRQWKRQQQEKHDKKYG